MNISSKSSILVFLLIAIQLVGCRSSYELSGTKRKNYTINDSLSVDSTFVRKYLPYKQQVEAQMNTVIGQSVQELPKNDELPETLLGNFFADAVLAEARKIDPTIDFTVPSTKGGLRTSLPEGNIRLSNIFELMPFENELLVLKVKGTDVEQLLQFIARSGGQPQSGIQMKIANQQPVEVHINGQPFDREKTYKILTSDYLGGGGDGIMGLRSPVEKTELGLKLRDALINYIKASTAEGKKINAQLDGRITKS